MFFRKTLYPSLVLVQPASSAVFIIVTVWRIKRDSPILLLSLPRPEKESMLILCLLIRSF